MLWGLGGVGALTLAPYLLPMVGVQSHLATDSYMHFLSGHAEEAVFGTGAAGWINESLSHIPLLGPALSSTKEIAIPGLDLTLSAGTLVSIASTAIIGIGGVMLANWLEKRESPDRFPWSKVIRYSALATSVLIAMPSILGGISVGLMFLTGCFSATAASHVGLALKASLGATSMGGAASGITAMVPHLFSCGLSLLPAGLAVFLSGKNPSGQPAPTTAPTYHCHLAAPCTPVRGQPCEVTFRLSTPDGRPLSDADLAILHTRPLHTMIVDSSLRDYHHLHPTYDPTRQCFVAQFTPGLQTSYSMWNDFTVRGDAAPTYLRTDLRALQGPTLPPRIQHTSRVEAEGLQVKIRPDTPLEAGGHHTLTLDIRDGAGQPVTNLEPIMGAYAHLVAFSADGQHFLHIHPLGPEPADDAARGQSPLKFHVMPKVDGPTQFFLQIQREGRIITLPFGQIVQKQHSAAAAGLMQSSIQNAIISSHQQHAAAAR